MNKRLLILFTSMYSCSIIAMDHTTTWQRLNKLPFELQGIITRHAACNNQQYKNLSDAVTSKCSSVFNETLPAVSLLNSVAVSPDNRFLLVGGGSETKVENWIGQSKKIYTGHVRAWDIKSKEMLHSSIYGGSIISVAIAPDSNKLAILSLSGFARIKDIKTDEELSEFSVSYAKKVAFSPDGQTVMLGSKTVNFFDPKTGNAVGSSLKNVQGHDKTIYSIDGKVAITLPLDPMEQFFRVWSITDIELMQDFFWPSNDAQLVATSVDDTLLAIQFRDVGVWVWDIFDRDKLITIDDKNEAQSISFASGNNELVIAQEKNIKVWDIKTGSCKYTFAKSFFLERIKAFAVSPDSSFIAVGYPFADVYIWDLTLYRKLDDILQLKPLLPQEINATTPQEIVKGQRRAFWRAYFMIQLVDAYKNKKKLSLDSYGKDGKGGFKYIIYTKFFDQEFKKLFEPFVQIKKQTLFSMLREKIGSKS